MIKLIKNKRVHLISIILFLNLNIVFAQQPDYLLKLGISYYNNADYKSAVEYLKRSIDITPQGDAIAEQYYWYAKTLFLDSLFNYYESLEIVNKAIEIDPSNAKLYFLRAQMREFVDGKTQEVKKDYEIAYNKASSNPGKDAFIKSKALSKIKGNAPAISYTNEKIDFLNSVNKFSSVGEYYYALAVIYSYKGDDNQAFFNLSQALLKGYIPYDYMYNDLIGLRDSEKFVNLMTDYKVPKKIYDVSYLADFEKFISMGEDGYNKNKIISQYVEEKINNWQKKGKFEKTSDYQKRVTPETRLRKVDYYTQAAIDSIGVSMLKWDMISNDYDADNETFKVSFPGFEPLYVQVPINEAPSFDQNFKSLEFTNMSFTLTKDFDLSILHLEITNPDVGKTYIYDSQNDVVFSATRLNLNFDDIEVPIDNYTTEAHVNRNMNTTKVVEVGKSDVDTDIPIVEGNNEKTIALIIGNEDYNKYQTGLSSESNVDFAKRDARIFSEYANKTLGIPKENITLLLDATSVQMQREIEKLAELADAYSGEANILFYYAGHGFPDEQTRESYLMPVDVSGADVRHGIKLNELYKKLTQYPSKKVVVLLDACFSGGGRNQGLLAARGVRVKPKVNAVNGGLVVIASSTGEQSSLPYSNKQHGMFTYFLLKKIKETKGEITLEQLNEYLSREVQINSLKINSKKQNPSILVSPDVENLWMDWTIN